jgi:hypothetical protein
MENMRAKFVVNAVKKYGEIISTFDPVKGVVVDNVKAYPSQETLVMSPVCPKNFGPNGEDEDNDFHRYSPSGSLELTITNPHLLGRFKPGQKYYIDFTLVDK